MTTADDRPGGAMAGPPGGSGRYPPGGRGRAPAAVVAGGGAVPAAGRGGPRRFPRRVGLLVAVAVGLLFLASGLAWRLLWDGQHGPGDGGQGWSGPPFPLLILGLLGVAFVVGRAVRRLAAPIGEVMEAADRVAGDYLDPGPGPRAGRSAAWPTPSTR